jgi:hypothetical protein
MNRIIETLKKLNPEARLFDGLDDALVGIAERSGQPALAVYDRQRCIELLADHQECDLLDAEEFFDLNVAGVWVGEHTPIVLVRRESLDDLE